MDQETANNIASALGKAEPFVAPLNPLVPVGLRIVGALIKAEPKLESTLRALFAKPTLTQADFDAASEHVAGMTYEQLCPHTELRPEPSPKSEG